MPDNENYYSHGWEDIIRANEHLQQNPSNWPSLSMMPTPEGYVVKGISTYTLPLPEKLKSDTIHALLHELVEPSVEDAALLEECDLSYQVVNDWDGPGQIVEVVLTAPKAVYDQLQNKKIYGNIISVLTTMVCDNIGSDTLQCRQDEVAV